MVDAHFHAIAMQRKHAAFQAEREAKSKAQRQARFRAEQASGPKVIHLDGAIGQASGEVSAAWLRSQMPTDGREMVLKIHSEGGSVFEAFAMFDMLAEYRGPKRCEVASMAFSAASLLVCCFDDSVITRNGFTMIHSPRMESDNMTSGESELLDELRGKMLHMYCQRTGKPEAVISRLMDNEAYFDAEASVDFGLVHRVASAAIAAKAIPSRVMARMRPSTSAKALWKASIAACGSVMAADRQNPGLRLKMLSEVNSKR